MKKTNTWKVIVAIIIGYGIWASFGANILVVSSVFAVVVALVGRWALNQAKVKVAAVFILFTIAIVGAGITCGIGFAESGKLRSIVPLVMSLAVLVAVLAVVFWPGGRKALLTALKTTVSLLLAAAIVSLPVQGQTVKTASVAVKVSSGSGSANGIAQTNTIEVVQLDLEFLNKGLKPGDKGWIDPNDKVELRKYVENYLVEAGYLYPAHQHQDGIRPAGAVWIVVILIIVVGGIIICRLVRFCQDHFGAPPAPPPGQGNLSGAGAGYASVDPLWQAYSYLGTCPAGPPSVGLSAASVAPPLGEQAFEVSTVIRPITNWLDEVSYQTTILGVENLRMIPRSEWEAALAAMGLSFTNGSDSKATMDGQPIADEARPIVIQWGIPYATNTAYWSGPFFWQTIERAPTVVGPWKTIFTSVIPAGVTNLTSIPVIAPWEWQEVAHGSFFRAMTSPY